MPADPPPPAQPSQQKPSVRDPGLTVGTPDEQMDAQMKALGAQLKEMGAKMKQQGNARQPAMAPADATQMKAMGSRMKDMGAKMQKRGRAMQMTKSAPADAGAMGAMSPDMMMQMGGEMMGMSGPMMEMGPMDPAKMMEMGDGMMGMMGMGAKPMKPMGATPPATAPAPPMQHE